MTNAQKRALRNYRSRLSQRGLARFEVLGREIDRALIRSVARVLARGGPEAKRLRAMVQDKISEDPAEKGGILAALRASPLVGAGLELKRAKDKGRKVTL